MVFIMTCFIFPHGLYVCILKGLDYVTVVQLFALLSIILYLVQTVRVQFEFGNYLLKYKNNTVIHIFICKII